MRVVGRLCGGTGRIREEAKSRLLQVRKMFYLLFLGVRKEWVMGPEMRGEMGRESKEKGRQG